MLRRTLLVLAIPLFSGAASAWAQGDYYHVHLFTGQPVLGRLGEITKDKVVLQVSLTTKEFPVNEIKYLQLPGEPRDLMEARNSFLDGHYDQALDWLNKIPPPALASDVVRQDVDFYRALANARLAINGVGDPRAAGTALIEFLKANPDSYHFYEANETAGDLLMAIGRYDQAPTYYGALANAPWPDYKLRAAVALGRVLVAQGKYDEAIRQFDAALATDAKGKAVEMQLLAARVGKAKCLEQLDRAKEAVDLLNAAIDQAPAENNDVFATAYNALGNAYLKLKQPQEALYAYLHVDVLYNQLPEQHAEALYHLKDLWTQMNKPDRAKEAADTLKSRYPTSPWNK
ncbi:MAG TPA: tetratricopeptide repeat protein [Pirellulales bacterium]|nr:tetratricopeptide repeat protein [Pirellulales bacterium]